MLQQLAQYAESAGIVSEPGFANKKVHWAINVSAGGEFLGLEDLKVGKSGREFVGCPNLLQPELIGGGNDNPRSHFLIESVELLLIYSKKPEADERKVVRQRKKREFFIQLLDQVSADEKTLDWISGASSFLRAMEQVETAKNELIALKGSPTDTAIIFVESKNPLDTPTWRDWWLGKRMSLSSGTGTGRLERGPSCDDVRDLLTGELALPLATHPKVKGLAGIGGLGTGDALVSFDKNAFQSYGLQQSRNAPLSEESATRYVAALDHLIARGEQLAGTKICYWYSGTAEEDPFAALIDPESQVTAESSDVRSLVGSIRTGAGSTKVHDRFYYLTVSGCSGRVMVRDWCEGSFERLQSSVATWFKDLAIVHRDGQRLAPTPKFWSVLASLFRDPQKEIPAPLAQDLFRRAVNGHQLPPSVLALAVRRIRADLVDSDAPPLNHTRMGLIKAYHNRKNGEQVVETHLRIDHPEPAYHCGRLLAVLAQLQEAAIPGVGAGVVQRYYSATSQTPALTLGRLLSNAQNHLNKLSGGLANFYNGVLSDVLVRVDSQFPQTLTLEKQSLFALGYYQQMAEMRRKRTERRAENQNANTNEGVTTNEPS